MNSDADGIHMGGKRMDRKLGNFTSLYLQQEDEMPTMLKEACGVDMIQ